MPQVHIAVHQVLHTITTFQRRIQFIEQTDCFLTIWYKSTMTVQMLPYLFYPVISTFSLKMKPEDCPWIIRIGSIGMSCQGRYKIKITRGYLVRLFINSNSTFSFMTINKDVLISTIRPLPVM